MIKTISISREFTDTPGARYISDGEYSGEEFYIKILKDPLKKSIAEKSKLLIDLDNTWGYASSFLSEVLLRAIRDFGKASVTQTLEFKSEDEPQLLNKILQLIEEIQDERN